MISHRTTAPWASSPHLRSLTAPFYTDVPSVVFDTFATLDGLAAERGHHLYARLEEILAENSVLKQQVHCLYRRQSNAVKKGGDPKDFAGPLTMRQDGSMFSCKHDFFQLLLERNGAPAITWHHDVERWMCMDADLLKTAWAGYKKRVKAGQMRVRAYNNFANNVNGLVWFGLTVQTTDRQGTLTSGLCLGSAYIFSRHVKGFVYWFTKEANRDAYFRYLNVVFPRMRVFVHDLKEKPEYNQRVGVVQKHVDGGRWAVQLTRDARDGSAAPPLLLVREEKFSEADAGAV